MSQTSPTRRKLLPEMNGASARWYARLRGSERQLTEYREQAAEFAGEVPADASVLEIACGPGYLAVELARLGLRTAAVDIAPTFVEITLDRARQAGLEIDVRQGDAARLPFSADSFDLIVCQAAFKNFSRPLEALDEIFRVLRPGGLAIIQDMRKEADAEDIDREVRRLQATGINRFVTRRILSGLRRRAYRAEDLLLLAGRSSFGTARLDSDGLSHDVRLRKPAAG